MNEITVQFLFKDERDNQIYFGNFERNILVLCFINKYKIGSSKKGEAMLLGRPTR
jgi:hypothetical protein